jgi:uncharacterized OsmC-like protein
MIETDAPLDNHGKGERFSPTDLVATAVASCMATIMGMLATKLGVDLDGSRFEVTKIMGTAPRRIIEVQVMIHINPLAQATGEQIAQLEQAGRTCPVLESLHPDLKKNLTFVWPVAEEA